MLCENQLCRNNGLFIFEHSEQGASVESKGDLEWVVEYMALGSVGEQG